ncbi:MAG: hypothetical protein AAF456_20085 [Planctomycetota bacterium]
MKILEKEIDLREETRGVEQARPQLETEMFAEQASGLSETQMELAIRVEDVIEMIKDLPEGEQKFRREIGQLTGAMRAMWDADGILAEPDTGRRAIAAETEAIEWLLQAKRSGGGGGGGGSNPGGGTRQGADLSVAALALLGESRESEAQQQEREVSQSTGNTNRRVPAQLRDGLDAYFELLENQGGQ